MSGKIADLTRRRVGRGGQRARRPCPICGAAPAAAFQPFCSRRCADIDLGRWLKEGYRVPSEEAPGPDNDGSGPGGDAD